jgi:membrane associated rhomboid family serine protease
VSEEQPIVLVLPRFTPWMKRLAIFVSATWLVEVLLVQLAPAVARAIVLWLSLQGYRVIPGLQLWRLASYPFIEDPTRFGVIWTVITLWLIGAPIERAQGPRRIAELFVAGSLGGGLGALAASRLSINLALEPVMGMDGFSNALLAAMGFLFAEQQVTFFGLGPMRGKHLVLALAALSVLMALISRSAMGAASVGGLIAGAAWMWWVSRKRPTRGAERPARSRRSSGARFRVVRGGRDDDKDKFRLN